MNFMTIPAMRNHQKQDLIRRNYREIYNHELAHKNAAGSYGGPIVIEKNSEGIPIGGHVSIEMTRLNKENPTETIEHADTVIKAAMAPSDPSAQDYKVAAEARSIKSKSESLENKKRLNYYA